METVKSIRVTISGRVQGVGFRDWTARVAESLGLSGWVRNRWSGEVEALFEGPEAAVDAMLAQCRTGPRMAQVTEVGVQCEAPQRLAGFTIKPTL